jgi:hypothetical protein
MDISSVIQCTLGMGVFSTLALYCSEMLSIHYGKLSTKQYVLAEVVKTNLPIGIEQWLCIMTKVQIARYKVTLRYCLHICDHNT